MCFSVIEFVICPFYNIRDTGLKIVLLYAESHGYMDGNIFIAYNTFAYCDVDFIHKGSGIIKIHFGKKEKKKRQNTKWKMKIWQFRRFT